jgi:hypothetical protein
MNDNFGLIGECWLVGRRIGDRHASNFMYEEKSGRLVGIDFGHAFGSATTLLPGMQTDLKEDRIGCSFLYFVPLNMSN